MQTGSSKSRLPLAEHWAIGTWQLTKCFPKNTGWGGLLPSKELGPAAVDSVDLSVRHGELFGLLGPNGAGKTTLIKMLSTMVAPTSGTARVNGFDLTQDAAIKASLGLVTSDERSFYWRLSGRQNLDFFARLHGLDGAQTRQRVSEMLEQVDMQDRADQRFLTYSTGMRQRLSIARALLHQPRLLFLDEPTKGLDPSATRSLHHLLRQELVEKQGITVLLTTHDLPEAEELCDRIAILHRGRIQAVGSPSELRSDLDLDERIVIRVDHLPGGSQQAIIERTPQARIQQEEPNDPQAAKGQEAPVDIELPGSSQGAVLNAVIDQLREAGVAIQSITNQAVSLETVFAHHTSELITGKRNAAPTPAVSLQRDYPPAAPPLVSQRTSPPPGFWRIAPAFLRRDLVQEASYRLAFLLQFANILFSVLVFYFISELLGEAAAPYLAQYGGDYFSFVLIGIAFLGYFSTGLSSFAGSLRHAQTTGTLEAMLATPTRLSAIILASSLWDYLVTTLRVVVFLVLGSLLMPENLSQGNYPAALLVLALTVVSASSLGIIAASFVMVIKRGDPINWGFGLLNGIFGGVYFPTTLLPASLAWISYLLPIAYSLDAMRRALLQGASWEELGLNLLALAGFAIVLLPFSLFAFRYAVRRAKAEGSLTQY